VDGEGGRALLVPVGDLLVGVVVAAPGCGVEESSEGVTALWVLSLGCAANMRREEGFTKSAPCGSSSPPKSSDWMLMRDWSMNPTTWM
jgi:hypothetical protein